MMDNAQAGLRTLYMRKEVTTDALTKEHCPEVIGKPGYHDVAIYRDRNATQKIGVYRWDNNQRPDRRTKYTYFNCFRWNVQWLPEVSA